MFDIANSGVNGTKFITFAAVPYILPFVQTKLGAAWLSGSLLCARPG